MSSSTLVAARPRHLALWALTSLSFFAAAAARSAPIISGTPPATAAVGTAYSFQPTARDPSGLKITFKISNKPSWASFDSTTGRLYGTPSAANVGTYRWVQIAGYDSSGTSWLPSYTLTVSTVATSSSSSSSGTQPAISGTPPSTATVGAAYSFQPTLYNPSSLKITFQVSNKPAWASFDTSTGRLYGTPSASNVGTYRWVQIAANDGSGTLWLPSYTITVSGTSTTTTSSTGAATVSWIPPTLNTDGSTLTNLAGYHIYYGTNQSSLDHVVNITNPGLTAYVVSNLSATTWYFAMSTVNSAGTEGPRSAVMSHVVQ